LIDQGVEVVGCDNMNDYYDVRLKEHRLKSLPDFEFHRLDIENSAALGALFKKHSFDVVFNLAARAGVRYSMENPEVYFTTNTLGVLHLLESMRQTGCGKMVLASTSSLYAGEALPFSESAAVNQPISPYAASKKAAEVLTYTYHYQYGIDCSVVRYFTVYGPAGRPDMSILKFIWSIDLEKEFELYGDGEQSRDFTYVDDIASGTIKAARKTGHEIFNLGGGRTPVTINTMIQWMEEGLGKKAKIVRKPAAKADMQDTQADIAKARRILEWQPETDFRTGLEQTIAWYLKNKEFLRTLKM
jgi:nucleoside-diphosphate-sugar epimerase